jgi:hypothetical protein
MAKRCDHDDNYVCQKCGECYQCQHEQEEFDGYIWWKCRFQDRVHRTNTAGKIVEIVGNNFGQD